MAPRALALLILILGTTSFLHAATRVPGTLVKDGTLYSGHYTLDNGIDLAFEPEGRGTWLLDLGYHFDRTDDGVVIRRGSEKHFANIVRVDLVLGTRAISTGIAGGTGFDVIEEGSTLTFEYDEWSPRTRQYSRRQTKRSIDIVNRTLPPQLPFQTWSASEEPSQQRIAVHTDDRRLFPVVRVGRDPKGKPLYVFTHDLEEGGAVKIYAGLESRLAFASGKNLHLVEKGRDDRFRELFRSVAHTRKPLVPERPWRKSAPPCLSSDLRFVG